MTDEILEQSTVENKILQAIAELGKQLNERMDGLQNDLDSYKKETNIQFEAIRQGLVENSARFDQLEALSLEAKSIALVTRSRITILTEEVKNSRKVLI